MRHTLTFKHVSSKASLEPLIEELIEHLERQANGHQQEAMTVHVAVENNHAHKLVRSSVTCVVPRKTLAAHAESHDAVASIRSAFEDVDRQLKKYKARLRGDHLRRKASRKRAVGVVEPEDSET